MSVALYIHVPFCQTKCSYCNFNTYERIERLIPAYLGAVKNEVKYWGGALAKPEITSVFLGGGTPSWLPARDVAMIMEAVHSCFQVSPNAEITAEVNPGDATVDSLTTWMTSGINRLSFGVQSLRDEELRALTRRHSAREAVEAVQLARGVGFDNLSVDLMYGLPNQTLDQWAESIGRAVALGTEHLSLYALGIEEGTPLYREVVEGRLPHPNPDIAAEMYELAETRLGAAGYEHYEISNWAKPGRGSRHNLAYWLNKPFVGLGPGAHSYLEPFRFWNIKSPTEYISCFGQPVVVDGGLDPIKGSPVIDEWRKLSPTEIEAEASILKLRLSSGLADAEVPAGAWETLREFETYGLLEHKDGVARLTSRGRLLSNELFSQLLPDTED